MTNNKMPPEIKKYTGLLQSEQSDPSKLRTWQKQAVMLHLEGYNAISIAEMVHKSPNTVRQLLSKESTKKLIEDYYSFLDDEYRSLYKLAVNAMREAMSPEAPLELRVNTAKYFLEKQGKHKDKDRASEFDTAEGIVQQIINVYNDNRGNPNSQNSIPIAPNE